MLSHPLLRIEPVWKGWGVLGLRYGMIVRAVSLVYVLLLLQERKRLLIGGTIHGGLQI